MNALSSLQALGHFGFSICEAVNPFGHQLQPSASTQCAVKPYAVKMFKCSWPHVKISSPGKLPLATLGGGSVV